MNCLFRTGSLPLIIPVAVLMFITSCSRGDDQQVTAPSAQPSVAAIPAQLAPAPAAAVPVPAPAEMTEFNPDKTWQEMDE